MQQIGLNLTQLLVPFSNIMLSPGVLLLLKIFVSMLHVTDDT